MTIKWFPKKPEVINRTPYCKFTRIQEKPCQFLRLIKKTDEKIIFVLTAVHTEVSVIEVPLLPQ